MTETNTTTAPTPGAITLSRHDVRRLDAGLGYVSDALSSLMDLTPDYDGRLTIGLLGLVNNTVTDMLGILDGWDRRAPVEESPAESTRRLARHYVAHAKAGNVYPDVARAHLSVTTAKDDAQSVAMLIQAAIAGADRAVLTEAMDRLSEMVGLLNKADALLAPHATFEEGSAAHA